MVPVFVMIVPDLDAFTPMMEEMEKDNGYVYLGWYYGCDLDESKDKIIEVYNHLRSGLYQREELAFLKDEDGGYHYYSSCWPAEFEDMLGLYGGVFFIGIILSILFISAMVLIISCE